MADEDRVARAAAGTGEVGAQAAGVQAAGVQAAGAPGEVGARVAGAPSDGRAVVVRLELPFAVEARGRREREVVVGWDGERTHAYLQALQREIAANAGQFDDCTVRAVRLGGGIATNARADDLCQTCRVLHDTLHVAPHAPTSARASICNISGASMPLLRRAGVTRLDFELLSLDAGDFARLNHSDALQDLPYIVDCFLHAYANRSLGVVLAYGYDAPDTRAFRRSIVEFTRMPASHLILERWRGRGVARASAELEAAQLAEARAVLDEAGWREYAPLAFAQPGEEDPVIATRHAGGEVLAFGLGATTHFGGVETTNTADWDTYLAHSDDFARITADVRRL